MNILIPDSWLRDFIKTEASPPEIAKALSLCSLGVEKIHQKRGDFIYEIETPPNRYDCLSVLGVAREAAAALPRFGRQTKFSTDQPASAATLHRSPRKSGKESSLPRLQVKIENPALCPRFSAIVLDNITVRPSPAIVQNRLAAAGIRALNNIVDATNYVMIALGQPLHAFDFDKLASHQTAKLMILRESRAGERLKTLDGVTRRLPSGSIIIEDGKKLIDLGGIMGGENSAIDKNTRRVILFAQIYEPTHIRRTSMSLPLRTEAAQRFEKGLDPNMVLPALERATAMLSKNAGARIASKLVDTNHRPFKPHRVFLTRRRLNQYLGVDLKPREIVDILESLGLKPGPKTRSITLEYRTKPKSKNHSITLEYWQQLEFTVPSWRNQDINIEEDLVEEVARIYGYHNLPTTLPKGAPPFETQDKKFETEKRLKYLLKDLGFTEVYTYSLIPRSLKSGGELKIKNPISKELVYLRMNLVPSLLRVVEANRSRFSQIKIFEMANVYLPTRPDRLPREKMSLTCLATLQGKEQENFTKIKGLLERVLKEIDVGDYTFKPSSSLARDSKTYKFDPRLSAVVWPSRKIKSGTVLGPVGKIKDDIYGFTVCLEALTELAKKTKDFSPPNEHPPVIEDISLYIGEATPFAEVKSLIKKTGGRLLSELKLIDRFQDEKAKKRKEKSFTFRLVFLSPVKSLSEKDIAPIRGRIVKALEKNGAKVRRR